MIESHGQRAGRARGGAGRRPPPLLFFFFFLLSLYIYFFFITGLSRGARPPPLKKTRPPPTIIQTIVAARLEDSLGQPESAVASSLLLGARQDIPQAVTEDFRASGLAHLLAVSGYNVTIVANGLLWLGRRRFARRRRTPFLLLCLVG